MSYCKLIHKFGHKKDPLVRAGLLGSVGCDETAVSYWVRFMPERCFRPEVCC